MISNTFIVYTSSEVQTDDDLVTECGDTSLPVDKRAIPIR